MLGSKSRIQRSAAAAVGESRGPRCTKEALNVDSGCPLLTHVVDVVISLQLSPSSPATSQRVNLASDWHDFRQFATGGVTRSQSRSNQEDQASLSV